MTEPDFSRFEVPGPGPDFATNVVALHLARKNSGRGTKGPWLFILAALAFAGASFARGTSSDVSSNARTFPRETGSDVAKKLVFSAPVSLPRTREGRVLPSTPSGEMKSKAKSLPSQGEETHRPIQHVPLCDCGPGAIVCSCAP